MERVDVASKMLKNVNESNIQLFAGLRGHEKPSGLNKKIAALLKLNVNFSNLGTVFEPNIDFMKL